MRIFETITFSDLIVILGIIITIGLAVAILWAELTIKRRWDTLHLKKRQFRKYLASVKGSIGNVPFIPCQEHYLVKRIVLKGKLAAGIIHEIESTTGKYIWGKTVMFDYRNAVSMIQEENSESKKELLVIIPRSAILAIFSSEDTSDTVPQPTPAQVPTELPAWSTGPGADGVGSSGGAGL